MAWRRFGFFQQHDLGQPPLLQAGIAACCGLADGGVALADVHGVCHLLDRDLKEWCAFGAHDRGVKHLLQPQGSALLLSIGLEVDGGATRACMRVWRPEGAESAGLQGTATCLRTLKIFGGPPEPAVTCCAAATNLSQVALGLEDGNVVLLRCADLQRDRFLKFKPLPSLAAVPKRRAGEDGGGAAGGGPPPANEPVTAVHFCHAERDGQPTDMFVVRRDAVFSVSGGGLRHEACRALNEAAGSEAGCCCLSDREELVVGRREAVYFYSAEERGPCFAFDGEKAVLSWHRGFLLVASRADGADGSHSVQVYDLKNKFVAFSATLSAPVRWLLSGPKSVLVIAEDGKVCALEERDLATKLESLFRKNLYPTAIALAKSQCFDSDATVLAEVHQRFAEHLYAKGDYDGAADQFVLTIGHTEPTRVIRKFLEAQHIRHLARYLHALHNDERAPASREHTTLLLSCLTKLKDEAQLDAFIASTADGPKAESFHAEAAIKVCRSAGYAAQALVLARRHKLPELALQVLVLDLHDLDGALELVSSMPPQQARHALLAWGEKLLAHRPPRATTLLVECYLAEVQSKRAGPGETPAAARAADSASDAAGVDAFMRMFAHQLQWLAIFLERLLEHPPQPAIVWDSLLELCVSDAIEHEGDAKTEGGGGAALAAASPPDTPATAITSVAGGPAAAPAADAPSGSHIVAGTTGSTSGAAPASSREAGWSAEARHSKAMALLRHPRAGYTEQQALLLCSQHHFEAGLLFLYERLHQPLSALRHHIAKGDLNKVLATCRRFGEQHPQLWLQALRFLATLEPGTAASNAERLSHIGEAIRAIERDQLLPPLVVLQALSEGTDLPLSVARDYLVRQVAQDAAVIDENVREAARFEEDTRRMTEEVSVLTSQPRVFQLSKCCACQSPLELPSVHFLCMHSFHQACLGDNDHECPVCAPQHRRVKEHVKQQQQRALAHDDFFKQLELSADGFSTVSEFFGRGMFCSSNNNNNNR